MTSNRFERGTFVAAASILISLVITRLPLLGNGYGSDDDAWRAVVAALRMYELGHYIPSRVPGFPVFEGVMVALVPFGWWVTNAAAVLASAVAVLFFYLVARRAALENREWLTAAFGFGPALWVACAQSMDYAFGLAFLLAATWALIERRAILGGVLLALAAGCRPSLAFLALPVADLAGRSAGGWRALLRFAVAFVAVGAVVFLPVALAPEARGLERHAVHHIARQHVTWATLIPVLRRAAVFLFGKLGLLALATAIVVGMVRRLRRDDATRGEREGLSPALVRYETISVGIVVVLYLLIPLEPAYLLPALPFLLLLAARWVPQRWWVAIALLMASEALVTPLFDVHRLIPGQLFQEISARREGLEEARAWAARRPTRPSVFVIGRPAVHKLLILDPALERTDAAWEPFQRSGVALWTADRRVGYAATLESDGEAALLRAGYAVIHR